MYYRKAYIGDVPDILLRGNINYTNIKYIVELLEKIDVLCFDKKHPIKNRLVLTLQKEDKTYTIQGKLYETYSSESIEQIYYRVVKPIIETAIHTALGELKILESQKMKETYNILVVYYNKLLFIYEWLGKEHTRRTYLGELKYDNGEFWWPNKIEKEC